MSEETTVFDLVSYVTDGTTAAARKRIIQRKISKWKKKLRIAKRQKQKSRIKRFKKQIRVQKRLLRGL